jgi:hypothetical protein
VTAPRFKAISLTLIDGRDEFLDLDLVAAEQADGENLRQHERRDSRRLSGMLDDHALDDFMRDALKVIVGHDE